MSILSSTNAPVNDQPHYNGNGYATAILTTLWGQPYETVNQVIWPSLESGLSIIPIDHKSKTPLSRALPIGEDNKPTWKPFQERQPLSTEVEQWLAMNIKSMAAVLGEISGNAELLDFDHNPEATPRPYSADELFGPWWTACGDLVEQYDLPVWRTGGGGYAVAYRCETVAPNTKMAWIPNESAKAGRSIAIETRGEGGYALIPPSLHPSGNRYTMIRGDLTKIATIPIEVRAKFFKVALSLCLAPYAKQDLTAAIRNHTKQRPADCGDSVIDKFNAQNNIVNLLEKHGYIHAHGSRWVRPNGKSGSVDVFKAENVSFHWSSNDALHRTNGSGPVPVDPFQVYTIFEHDGDHEAAFVAAKKALGLWVEPPPPAPDVIVDENGNTVQLSKEKPTSADSLTPAAPPTQSVAPVERRTRFTVAQLYATEFPEPKYAVADLLPEGQTLLIARPKIGKSWLVLQIAVAVGTGGLVLGQKVEQGIAFYLALEDRPRRMADRLKKMSAPKDTNLVIENKWPPLHQGGAELLMKEIDKEGYSLVIVDTLQRAFAGLDMTKDGAKVTRQLAELQEFALERHVALVIVHHQRKSSGAVVDAIDDALGATGIAANADAAWLITRQRGQQTATFQVTGRDIEEKELAINFDKDLFCWQLQGDADGVRADTVQGRILAALKEFDECQATAAELGRFLGILPDNATRELGELLNKGKVVKSPKKGRSVYYQLASKVEEPKKLLAHDPALPARADIDG